MRKIVIFDFDGTLADSFPWFVARINQVARIFHFNEVKEEDLPRLRLMRTSEILNYLGISKIKLPFVIFYLKRLMSRESHSINLFPEVPALLKDLKKEGFDILVLSSNSKSNVIKILGPASEMVTAYYCGAGLNSKNKHFKQVMKTFSDSQFLSVGDEYRDYEAARQVGIAHINVSWGYASREAFGDLLVVDTFEDLHVRILRYFNMKS